MLHKGEEFISALVVLNIIFMNSTALKENPWTHRPMPETVFI